ncbi:MAG: hypothetical protein IKD96_06230 [Oscillospiraceae bacterium]|nr:hypothetical protein [Oscillospiraceae bacterium]
MLGKLIKYEFRATARYYLPIFAAMILLGLVLLPIAAHFQGLEFFRRLFTGLYTLAIVILAVMTLVVTIRRFYTHLLKDEGYLMFTLPVTAGQNILGKLIPAVVWAVVSIVLCFVTLLPREIAEGGGIHLHLAGPDVAAGAAILLVCSIVTVILLIAGEILFFYLCMAIGQLFNEHKFLAAVVTFLILSVVFNIVGLTGARSAVIFGTGFVRDGGLESLLTWATAHSLSAGLIAGLAMVVISLIICLILFFITRWLLNRKLNLS